LRRARAAPPRSAFERSGPLVERLADAHEQEAERTDVGLPRPLPESDEQERSDAVVSVASIVVGAQRPHELETCGAADARHFGPERIGQLRDPVGAPFALVPG
jgi:hypothetical protein